MENKDEVNEVTKSIWERPTPTTKTIKGCEELADNLFREIEDRFGEKEARRIFSSAASHAHSKTRMRKSEVLHLYYNMKP